ncbi:MAG: YraN family protein [Pseudomonadota bacterium]
MTNTRQRGHAGEDAALAYLQNQGLTLVTRNFAGRMGEIDLIMQDGNTLCFIEVRLRNNRNYASGAESITHNKIRKLIKTAQLYIMSHHQPPDINYRFDVVSLGSGIEWIKHAFTLDT